MTTPILVTPELFASSQTTFPSLESGYVEHCFGLVPVLVTSVHGFPHERDGRLKPADSGSLSFARLVAAAAGARLLAVSQKDLPDSNHYPDTPFKAALHAACRAHDIGLVVDIHGAHAARPFDLDLGTLHGQSWLEKRAWKDSLEFLVQQHGFFITDNAVFAAQGSTAQAETITACSMKQGVPCVQLEISSTYLADLDTRAAIHSSAKLANALAAFILEVGDELLRARQSDTPE